MVPIIESLLEDTALEEEEEYEYIPTDPTEHVEPVPHFSPKRVKCLLLLLP